MLVAVAVAATVGGYIATRPDDSTVFFSTSDATVAPDSAPPDSATPPDSSLYIDPLAVWDRHTISQAYAGADGVDLADVDGDGDMDIATAWEEGGAVTVSIRPGAGWETGSNWTTFAVGTSGLTGLEDAKFCDVDDDGRLDVVSACEGGQKISIHFAPTSPTSYTSAGSWTTVTISSALQRWNQVACGDFNGDGRDDIIAGGRRGTSGNTEVAAKIGIFYQPAASQRTAGSWSFTELSDAGWTMTLEAVDIDGDTDLDILVSDRLFLWDPPGTSTKDPSLTGARWLEQNPAGTFTNHEIAQPAGDIRFVEYDGTRLMTATANSPNARWRLHPKADPETNEWTGTVMTIPSEFGTFQAGKFCDLDGDGTDDLVVTASQAFNPNSGVLWLKGSAFTQRGEVSGTDSEKFDNAACYDVDADGDLDIITTEQNTGLGLIYYENPRL